MIKTQLEDLNGPQLQMLGESRASSAHDVVTASQATGKLEGVLTVKRHDCDCVRWFEKVDGRLFKDLD